LVDCGCVGCWGSGEVNEKMIVEAFVFGFGALFIVGLISYGTIRGVYNYVPEQHKDGVAYCAYIFFCLVFSITFLLGLFYIPPVQLPNEIRDEIVLIYSSDLSSTIHGDFLLGSGQVNSEFVYTFYKGDNINGFNLDFYPTSKSKIFMDENKYPYVKSIWMVNPNIGDGYEIYNTRHYEFHVPENSIIQKYDMSLR
jgi:hypothetical protein